MNSIPLEAQPFVIAAALFAVSAFVLAWLLRVAQRDRATIKRHAEDLESHLLRAQRDLASSRDDAAEWRARMQEQFDTFRASMTGQLTSAEARHERLQRQFDESSRDSDKVERELRTQVEVLRGMCAELPYARERLQSLERYLVDTPNATLTAPPLAVAPLPALFEESESAPAEQASQPEPLQPEPIPTEASQPEAIAETPAPAPAMPDLTDVRCNELEAALAHADQRNAALQRELVAARLRSARAAAVNHSKPKPRGR